MPGIDALRGSAVLAVFAYHGLYWWMPWAAARTHAVDLLNAVSRPGWLGVNLFFLLSGFLITGILIDTRSRGNYWKNFYVRRVLRILPLLLVVLLLVHFTQHLTWTYVLLCLLYLANFTQRMGFMSFGPLWSLAVEEQFYLVWPFLVRRFRLRTLGLICIVTLVLSPILRYLSAAGILPLGDPSLATWLISDGLAAGALLAILLRTGRATLPRVRLLTAILGVVGLALLGVTSRLHALTRDTPVGTALQPEPFIFLFAFLLLLSLQWGDNPTVFRLTGPLRFFGYISYGLYLLHLLLFSLYQELFEDTAHQIPLLTAPSLLMRFVVVLAATSLVCYLSRRYFEEYALRYKDRLVPYAPAPRAHGTIVDTTRRSSR